MLKIDDASYKSLTTAFPDAYCGRDFFQKRVTGTFDDVEVAFRKVAGNKWVASLDYQDSDEGAQAFIDGLGNTPKDALAALVQSMLKKVAPLQAALEAQS